MDVCYLGTYCIKLIFINLTTLIMTKYFFRRPTSPSPSTKIVSSLLAPPGLLKSQEPPKAVLIPMIAPALLTTAAPMTEALVTSATPVTAPALIMVDEPATAMAPVTAAASVTAGIPVKASALVCTCPKKVVKKIQAFQRPPSYTHLGFGKTLTELEQKIYGNFVPLQKDRIGLHEIILCDSPLTDSCTPYSSTFKKPVTEKVTVFYRIADCRVHKYLVICILHHGALHGPKLEDLKKLVFQEITPKIQYRQRSVTDKQIDKKTGLPCSCNVDGGTKTFGCTTCVVNSTACKFYKKPKQENTGRQKFALETKRDNATLKKVCETVCNMATDFVKNCAPLCYQNMADFSSDAIDCRIGTEPVNLFAAVTFVSDYSAHCHVDSNDNALGATVILSLRQNPGATAQLHYLPMYRLFGSLGPGVALDLGDGSLFMECAAMETHGSTPVENARKNSPERVGIVCFTHACLNKPHHGHLTTPAK